LCRCHYGATRTVDDPGEIAAPCAAHAPTTLLTWPHARPNGGFVAAVDIGRAGERLTLPTRTVRRTVVPSTTGIVHAGLQPFDWIHRHRLAIAGPTVEEHLDDVDGDRADLVSRTPRRRPGTNSTQRDG
jgi:hypothetical protein